ncbi:MAG: hypothetical protein ACKVU4_13435 [Phycisphaerales bacterium]
MFVSILAAAAAASLGQVYQVSRYDRPIATMAPYPANVADDVHRPGFNGRLWISRPVMGGRNGPYPFGDASPGAESYGAYGDEGAVAYARVGLLAIGIDPWESIGPENLRQLRRAQDFWLEENGYTGGVRTHVNDLYLSKHVRADQPESAVYTAKPEKQGFPEPRGIIEIAPETPRIKNRIKVEVAPKSRPDAIVVLSKQPVRVSMPPNAPSQSVARVETEKSEAPKAELAAAKDRAGDNK